MGGSSKTMEQVSQIDPAMQNITAKTPPWLQGTGDLTIPQAPPGQLQALASQLAQGGFGTPSANYGYLDTIYDPVNTLDFYKPGKPLTTTTTTNNNGGGTQQTANTRKRRGDEFVDGANGDLRFVQRVGSRGRNDR
jgi:hypothetical protein